MNSVRNDEALKNLKVLESKHRTNYIELLKLADQTYLHKNDVKPLTKLKNIDEFINQRNSLQISIEKSVAQIKIIEMILSKEGDLTLNSEDEKTLKKVKSKSYEEEIMAQDSIRLLQENLQLDQQLYEKLNKLIDFNQRLEETRRRREQLYVNLAEQTELSARAEDAGEPGGGENTEEGSVREKNSLVKGVARLENENEKLKELIAFMQFDK